MKPATQLVAVVKLEVGPANTRRPGWQTLDAAAKTKPDILHDATKPLPIKSNCAEYVYSEHFIEHLTREQAQGFCDEVYRVLRPGGVHRVATLCLDHLIHRYLTNWEDQEWLTRFGYRSTVTTRGQALNMCFYAWGHKYVFNNEDLTRLLTTAGHTQIKRCLFQQSNHPDLTGLEHRKDSTLILEAAK